jgi:ribosomal protein S18 acetylase RimI-like enzyme
VEVRPLQVNEVAVSARLHREVLGAEFLAGCGERFLQQYHKAWLEAPGALALAAVDRDGRIAGILLAAFQPQEHFRSMVRRRGAVLALALALHAVAHPGFGIELARTRGARYARGLFRSLRRGTPPPAGPPPAEDAPAVDVRTGEVTHVMVFPGAQNRGVGRALMERATCLASQRGLGELVLVTPPEAPARGFYQHLGWNEDGTVTSRSGERFVRYRLSLRDR